MCIKSWINENRCHENRKLTKKKPLIILTRHHRVLHRSKNNMFRLYRQNQATLIKIFHLNCELLIIIHKPRKVHYKHKNQIKDLHPDKAHAVTAVPKNPLHPLTNNPPVLLNQAAHNMLSAHPVNNQRPGNLILRDCRRTHNLRA